MVNGWIRFLKSQDSKKCYGIFKGNQQVEQHQQKQKKREEQNTISNNWDDPYIGRIIDQQEPQIMHSIINLINKGKGIEDTLLLKLFSKYTDDIIKNFGFDVLFDGLKNIAEYAGENTDNALKYIDTYNSKNKNISIYKGSMSQININKLMKSRINL